MLSGILLFSDYLVKVRGLLILFYSGIDLINISFRYGIQNRPDDRVYHNECSKIIDKAHQAMSHPMHKVCNWQAYQ